MDIRPWLLKIGLATLASWLAMFWTGRPAIDSPFVFAFLPFAFFVTWPILGWQLLTLMRRYPQPHRVRLTAVIVLAFFMGPYSLMRAGCDMFTLSVQYHLWRAGGTEKVRAAFNQWVASQPVDDPSNGRKFVFDQLKPGGNIVPLPSAQMPPEVRYIHEHFPTPLSRTWNDAAHLDNVYVLTTTDIMIGPPGWEPEGGEKLLYRIVGSRRKLGDGVWLQFGIYAK